MKTYENNAEAKVLRQKAEEYLRVNPQDIDLQFAEHDALALVHELQVHQIELELQNQELILAKEKAEKLATEKYQELYDFAPSGYFTLSADGKILELNLAGAKILGRDRLVLLSSRFNSFISKDSKSVFNFFLNKIFVGNAIETCEIVLSVESSFPIHLYLTGRIDKNQDQCLITAVDITEKAIAENALKQWVSFVFSNPSPVFRLDKEARIIVANPASYNLFPFNEIEGMCISGFLPGISKEKISAAIRDGSIINVEMEIEGQHFQFIIRGDHKLNIAHVYGTDITDIKKAELALIDAKEKAEESDRLKSAFLANMSHEIRTPINGILGFADLLKTAQLDEKERLKYIEIIERSGKRMLNTINNIIDISKIEAKLMEVQISEVNINRRIEFILSFFNPETNKKGIKLLTGNLLPNEEVFINTDKEKFNAILTNLVKNAINYTDSGTIEMGYTKKGKMFEFYVKDTGIGISENRTNEIFKRFVQADVSDKRAAQGSGLGLTITKAYVEMLNGKIWVESKEGKGSVFYFTLPANTEKEVKSNVIGNSPLKGTENSNSNSKLKILIVEDDRVSELLIKAFVKNITNNIVTVKSGMEAVEMCRKNPDINLVIMDIKMPGINGYEATREIRKFNNNMVIFAQTAFALPGEKEKAILAGCNDYISKPLDKNELLKLIKKNFNIEETIKA